MSKRRLVRVRDVMTAEYLKVGGLETVHEALQLMRESKASCLIVDKRHADDEYGIVLLPDIARRVLAKDRSPRRVNVYEIMSKPVIAVHPEMNVRYCIRLFESFGLTLAPVLDQGEIVGVVSYTEIVLHGLGTSDDREAAEQPAKP